ncbi:MAG: hypothetical protein Q4E99_01040 [Bacillota bacterium]|nr:hypothetical protein [Bacillota bacterium]
MKNSKIKLNKQLKSLAPPGADIKETLYIFGAEITIMVLISFSALIRIFDSYSVLDLKKDFFEKMMPHFSEIVKESFVLIWVIVLFNIAFGVANYLSFSKVTKSIYVMKRIPDSKEMFRRSFALPFAGIVIAFIIAIILLIIYYLLYRFLPPIDKIYPVQLTDFLRAFV